MDDVKKGFTLVELLVVVAILGVLAAVGIVSFGGYLGSAKENAAKANYKNFTQYAQSLLMKCHLGETKVYLKVNNESLPQSYNCEDAIQNFLNLFATHLRDFKGYKNPFRLDQPAMRASSPQDTLIGRIGYIDMWVEGTSPYAPINVSLEYAENKILKSTITVCLAGGCDVTE